MSAPLFDGQPMSRREIEIARRAYLTAATRFADSGNDAWLVACARSAFPDEAPPTLSLASQEQETPF